MHFVDRMSDSSIMNEAFAEDRDDVERAAKAAREAFRELVRCEVEHGRLSPEASAASEVYWEARKIYENIRYDVLRSTRMMLKDGAR